MNNPIERKIRWAAIFGLGFLLSVVIQQTLLRSFSRITTTNGDFPFIFILWSLLLLPFFATLILNVRGYIYLAEKYNHGILKLSAWIFSIAAALIYLLSLLSGFQNGTNVDTGLANGLIGLVLLPYEASLAVMGLGAYALKDRLGNVVFWPISVGALVLLELTLTVLFGFAGKSSPVFAGWYVWSPVFESLFVIASTPLFFRAARD